MSGEKIKKIHRTRIKIKKKNNIRLAKYFTEYKIYKKIFLYYFG